MIDIELVKLKYTRMEDAELMSLTQTSGYALSTEAISALYQEFLKRNLDMSIFPHLRALKWHIHKIKLAKRNQSKIKQYEIYLKDACIKEISEGKSLDDIFKKLQKASLPNGKCLQVINSLEEYAKEKKNIFDMQILAGVSIGFVGIFINSVISLTSTKTDAVITGWLLIVLGVIKIIWGFSKKGNDSGLFDILSTKENPYLGPTEDMHIKN